MGEIVVGSRRAPNAWEVERAATAEDFEALYEAHKRPAYRLALLLCGGETATAEDAVSEAFAQVLPRWRSGAVDDFSAYVRRSVVNQVKRTFLRRGFQRRSQALLQEPEGANVEEEVVRRQVLWTALSSLPVRERTAVVLHYYEALPVNEIASLMGTSVGTAKSHLSHGRDRLRTALGAER